MVTNLNDADSDSQPEAVDQAIIAVDADATPDQSGGFDAGEGNPISEIGDLDTTSAETADLGLLPENGDAPFSEFPDAPEFDEDSDPRDLAADLSDVGFALASGDLEAGAAESASAATDESAAQVGFGLGIILEAEFDTPETTFLQAVYRRVLGREVDAVGLKGFGDRLRAGESRETVVREIWESKEHRELQANLLVGDFFGGAGAGISDAAGAAPWLLRFSDGAGTLDVIRAMIASHTMTLVAEDDEEYLRGLYERLLEREPSDAELDTFLTDLRTRKIHTGDVADYFVNSSEFHEVLVRKLYAAYLDREPESPTGLEATTKALDDGQSLDEAAILILASDEFLAKVDGRLA
jgi:hypothetical protein